MKKKLCSVLVIAMLLLSSVTVFADTDKTSEGAITGPAVTSPASIGPAVTNSGITGPAVNTGTKVTVPTDVTGTSYEAAVKNLIEKGVIAGYPDGTFKPGNSINRVEAIIMIVKYLAPTQAEIDKAPANKFTDMSGSNWAAPQVNYAVSKGIVQGDPSGTFRPTSPVNYDEFATMLVNSLGYKSTDLTGVWPANYVNKAKDLGIFKEINVENTGKKGAVRGNTAIMLNTLDTYKTGSSVTKSAIDLMAAAEKKLADIKSMSYDMKMDLGISAAGEKINSTMTGNADITMNPIALYMKMKMDMGALGAIDTESYMITENNAITMYTLADGEWMKQVVTEDAASMMQYDAQANLELYLNGFETVRFEGKDTVNGKSATKVYCTLADDYFEKALNMAGMEATLEGMEVDLTMIENLFKDFSFAYSIWIDDATGLPVKYEIDMTELMDEMMADMAELTAKEDPEVAKALALISFDNVVMTMTITNTDNVKPIVLPEAAKSAKPMPTTSGGITK